MKYLSEIDINLPRHEVIALFDNPENMKKWQPELISFKHLSGTPGHSGAQSILKYKMGRREIEMTETITERNLPDVFSGTYEAKGVYNFVKNRFIEVSSSKTRWIAEHEFRFSGVMVIASVFMRKAFRKQTNSFMKGFKSFAESYSKKG